MTQTAGSSPCIGLLATDLDGTVIGGVQEFPLYSDFRRELSLLHETQDAVWVACTGRNLSSFVEFTMPMQRMGVVPDYVIVRHAYIYSRRSLCWWPHVLWNIHILYHAWVDRRAAEQALASWHSAIVSCSTGVRTRRRDRGHLVLRFDSSQSATEALNMLKRDFPACRHIQVAVNGNEANVRLVPFTKGLALSELARYLGVPRERIMAIGNGHNDISMLDGSVAGMTGCPSNSEPEVMDTVHRSGGHIADRPSLGGVLQVIEAYRSGTVSSALPEATIAMPRQGRVPQSRKSMGMRPKRVRAVLLLALVGYVVLAVFAYFGFLPFSDLIMKPFNVIERAIEKIIW